MPAAAASDDPAGHYATLALPSDCAARSIKQAYRKQALRWHPDKNPKGIA